MMLSAVYTQFKRSYVRMDPHHETWELWIKGKKSEFERYEVAIGTILVQNTNWKNVDKAKYIHGLCRRCGVFDC